MSKRVYEVVGEDKDGNEVKVVVRKPLPTQQTEAQIASSKMFRKAIDGGATTRSKLKDHLRREGLWNDEKEKELKDLTDKIVEHERYLANKVNADGERMTKADARAMCIDIRKWRNEQLVLLADSRQGDELTAEGISENTRFDYLVSVCTLNEDGSPHYDSLDDYLARADEGHPYVSEAAAKLATMLYNFDPESEQKRLENRVLKKLGFSNDEGSLVNEDGHLVDVEGRLIDKDGRWVDEEGNFVDREGNPVDEDGNPVCTSGYDEFLD